MFLRKNRKRFDGEIYEYWPLCESVRTEREPRQRVVASLGKFTQEEIVRKMEDRFGQAERIWVMDRGMVSEANITFLRERKALYIVGTPKSQLRNYESQLAEKEN